MCLYDLEEDYVIFSVMILQECCLYLLGKEGSKDVFLFNFFHWYIIINRNGVSGITSLVFVFNFITLRITHLGEWFFSRNTFSRCFNSSFSSSSVEHIKIALCIKLFNVPVLFNVFVSTKIKKLIHLFLRRIWKIC